MRSLHTLGSPAQGFVSLVAPCRGPVEVSYGLPHTLIVTILINYKQTAMPILALSRKLLVVMAIPHNFGLLDTTHRWERSLFHTKERMRPKCG